MEEGFLKSKGVRIDIVEFRSRPLTKCPEGRIEYRRRAADADHGKRLGKEIVAKGDAIFGKRTVVLSDFWIADIGRSEAVDEDCPLSAVDEEGHRPSCSQEVADHVWSGQGNSFF